MKRNLIYLLLIFIALIQVDAQSQSPLTIPQIMEGNTFIGTSPSRVYWGEHGEYLYFNWNPDGHTSDSLYRISLSDNTPQKVDWETRDALPAQRGTYNTNKTQKVYVKNGDVFVYDITKRTTLQITNTNAKESSPRFTADESQILFQKSNNLYGWNIATGQITQLTDFRKGNDRADAKPSAQDEWIEKEQMELISILSERKKKKDEQKKIREQHNPNRPKTIYIGSHDIGDIQYNGQYITYSLYASARNSTSTKAPNYVTESAYTENLSARPKVGAPTAYMAVGIYDIANDTTYRVKTDNLPGIDDFPAFVKDKDKKREVYVHAPIWSQDYSKVILIVRSKDNKDRWINQLDLATGVLTTLNHQHDDAWLAGPGIGWSQWDRSIGWLDDNATIWFQSEASGYSHLYTYNTTTKKTKRITKGEFEIYNPRLSHDQQHWIVEANKVHPGMRHVYQIPIVGGKMTALTTAEGKNEAFVSPNGNAMALLFSTANQPTELFLTENKEGATPQQITHSTTEAFKQYNWRKPEAITIEAEDGKSIHARLYKPANAVPNGPAVVFVHGAGYLQNAHKWWSSYYREYMFHNLLVDNGYTVLDIDYRGSAGYGRDWRTGIYQHMGGLDLSDHIDAAKYLVDEHQINASKIGIYGGSYGGFITLMAMFTEPDVFAAGAALRSVTDWAHYNHGYTSNILNTPVEDPEAYRKSSPIYFAEGLKGALLMCHGMIDTNVQFQDIVRLSQRLIELGKDNWELAVYPLEGHGFKEPSSWTDEYSRIFKLFEENLK